MNTSRSIRNAALSVKRACRSTLSRHRKIATWSFQGAESEITAPDPSAAWWGLPPKSATLTMALLSLVLSPLLRRQSRPAAPRYATSAFRASMALRGTSSSSQASSNPAMNPLPPSTRTDCSGFAFTGAYPIRHRARPPDPARTADHDVSREHRADFRHRLLYLHDYLTQESVAVRRTGNRRCGSVDLRVNDSRPDEGRSLAGQPVGTYSPTDMSRRRVARSITRLLGSANASYFVCCSSSSGSVPSQRNGCTNT